jgi:hypothetical protein
MAIDPNEGTRVWDYFVRLENGVAKEISLAPLSYKTSTGERPTDEWLVTDGFVGYVDPGKPSYDKYKQKVIKHDLSTLPIVNNVITQTYETVNLEGEELASATVKLREAINAERERRISLGCVVNVGGVGAISIKGAAEDMRNLTNLGQIANMSIMAGSSAPIYFRDNDNVMHALTPTQMSQLWQKAVYYVSLIYQASWEIKEMNPIPTDIDNEQYWPAQVI